jgi:TRAP-type C4-dicarboxylate transport system permease large subunit
MSLPRAWRVPGSAYGFLLVSVVAFIVLGSVPESIPAIVLLGPLLFPVAAQFGINEVHYAMVVILAMGLGLFALPFACAATPPASSVACRRMPACAASGSILPDSWPACS